MAEMRVLEAEYELVWGGVDDGPPGPGGSGADGDDVSSGPSGDDVSGDEATGAGSLNGDGEGDPPAAAVSPAAVAATMRSGEPVDAVVARLSALLSGAPSVTVRERDTGPWGATALAESLQAGVGVKLQTLTLDGLRRFDDVDVGSISAVLSDGAAPGLTTLAIERCPGVTTASAVAVSDAATPPDSALPELRRLSFRGSSVDDGAVPALQRLLETHPTLRELDVFDNNLSDDGVARLQLAARRRAGAGLAPTDVDG